MCNKDCFNCPFDDCVNDDLSLEEYKEDITNTDIPKSLKLKRNRANRYVRNHKQEIAEYQKKRYAENKAKSNEQSSKWMKDNKDRVATAKRERYWSSPDYYRQKQREYRARKKAERVT